MSYEQAYQKVERYIRDTIAGVTPRPRLEVLGLGTISCSAGFAGRSDAMMVEHTYFLRGFPVSENASVKRQIRAYWKNNGFKIIREHEYKVVVQHRKSGFLVSLAEQIDAHALSIRSQSPCIREPKNIPRPVIPSEPSTSSPTPASTPAGYW
jgi:hypothetical protein